MNKFIVCTLVLAMLLAWTEAQGPTGPPAGEPTMPKCLQRTQKCIQRFQEKIQAASQTGSSRICRIIERSNKCFNKCPPELRTQFGIDSTQQMMQQALQQYKSAGIC